MNQTSSLRERKKNQTKQALIESAYKLFEKHGFSKTSINDITREANFAPRTFFLHFDSKEDLLFPDEDLLVDSLTAALAERSSNDTALETLRVWAKEIVFQKESGTSTKNILRRKIIDSDKALQARQRLNLNVIEDILANAIAFDMNVSIEQTQPRIVAAATIAVFGMLDEFMGHNYQSEAALEAIDVAIDFLEGGLKSINTNKNI